MRGWLAAHLVARLTAEANRWMVDLLEVRRDDRVLDVGCGPGLAVAYAAQVCDGPVVGVDPSGTMVRQARRRNRSSVREGRVEIGQADASRLPFRDASFTRVGSLNSMQFWPRPEEGLGELYRVLEPGGRAAVVLMARSDEPGGPTTPTWVEETVQHMRAAGFSGLRIASRTFGGVLHRALVALRPQEEAPRKRRAPFSTPRRTG